MDRWECNFPDMLWRLKNRSLFCLSLRINADFAYNLLQMKVHMRCYNLVSIKAVFRMMFVPEMFVPTLRKDCNLKVERGKAIECWILQIMISLRKLL